MNTQLIKYGLIQENGQVFNYKGNLSYSSIQEIEHYEDLAYLDFIEYDEYLDI